MADIFIGYSQPSSMNARKLAANAPPYVLPLTCPNCGADMRIVAYITEAAPVDRILTRIGEPA